jgi:hypothetical protein
MSVETLKVRIVKKAWEDPTFKQSLLADPKSAIRQSFGVELPEETELQAVAETPTRMYLVIPPKPEELRVASESEPQIFWN